MIRSTIVFSLILIISSFCFAQDEGTPLDFVAGDADDKITVTTGDQSWFSASIFKVGDQLVRARLRKIEIIDGNKIANTWRIPSLVKGRLQFTEDDKAWREIIGVVDCKLQLIRKKILVIVPAQAEKLIEEKK